MTLRWAVKVLLGVVLGLPLLQAMFLWVAGLLQAMGDEAAAVVIGHLNIAAGVLWLAAMVAMVVTLAIQSLERPPDE